MEEAWVKELRSQFPVTEKSAFFDIAYENCGADYMERAIERFFRDKADLAPDMPKADTLTAVSSAIRVTLFPSPASSPKELPATILGMLPMMYTD